MQTQASDCAVSRPPEFVPRRWLAGPHRQTVAGALLPRPNLLPVAEERLFRVDPEVQVLCLCHWQPERRRAMTLLLVHGLEGSANSQYVIGAGGKAWTRGWNVVRMNVRNCGGSERLGPTLYHSGLSGDIERVISTLLAEDGLQAIALAGFSMGGNQVLKCAGEWGAQAPAAVRAVVAVSPACDLGISADRLHLGRNRLYEIHFLRSLFRSFRRKARCFPGQFDTALLRGVRSVRQFDEYVTARYMGFTGADDYYTRASATPWLEHIAVPTLVIHSLDDPFVTLSPETEAKLSANPNVENLRTAYGGHCAFLADPSGDDGRWAEERLIEFIERQ